MSGIILFAHQRAGYKAEEVGDFFNSKSVQINRTQHILGLRTTHQCRSSLAHPQRETPKEECVWAGLLQDVWGSRRGAESCRLPQRRDNEIPYANCMTQKIVLVFNHFNKTLGYIFRRILGILITIKSEMLAAWATLCHNITEEGYNPPARPPSLST